MVIVGNTCQLKLDQVYHLLGMALPKPRDYWVISTAADKELVAIPLSKTDENQDAWSSEFRMELVKTQPDHSNMRLFAVVNKLIVADKSGFRSRIYNNGAYTGEIEDYFRTEALDILDSLVNR